MDALPSRPEHAVQEDTDEAAQLLLGGLALAGDPGRLARLAHGVDGALQDLAVEAELVPEVVVHRGHVRVRGLADLPHGDPLEPPIAEEALRGDEEAGPGLRVRLHSVRLKSRAARPMAIAEKTERNRRSKAMASKPVFLRSRHLNACTA